MAHSSNPVLSVQAVRDQKAHADSFYSGFITPLTRLSFSQALWALSESSESLKSPLLHCKPWKTRVTHFDQKASCGKEFLSCGDPRLLKSPPPACSCIRPVSLCRMQTGPSPDGTLSDAGEADMIHLEPEVQRPEASCPVPCLHMSSMAPAATHPLTGFSAQPSWGNLSLTAGSRYNVLGLESSRGWEVSSRFWPSL